MDIESLKHQLFWKKIGKLKHQKIIYFQFLIIIQSCKYDMTLLIDNFVS